MFNRIGTEQGLAPGNVNDIIQDSLGFIWLGTESGLCRFDGYDFKIFKNERDDTNSLSFNHVFSLLKGENGILWIGTLGGGLNKFNSKTGSFKRYLHDENNSNSISNNIVFKVLKDSKNRIWISTLGGGLNLFDPDTELFRSYLHDPENPKSISSNIVSTIYEDSNGEMWVGTFDNGLNLFIEESADFKRFNYSNNKYSINHNQVMDVIEYEPGILLVATFGGGINVLNIGTMKFSNYQNSSNFQFKIEHRNVRKLLDDGENIWIGSYNGLYRFEKSSGKINKFLYDQNNPKSLNNNKIRGLFKDRSDLVWIGTTNGVNLYDPNRKIFEFHPFPENFLKPLGQKFAIPVDEKETDIIWAGSFSNNSDKNRIKFIKYYGDLNVKNSFKSNISINFYEDSENTLWIGNYNGLKWYDNSSQEFKYVEYFTDGSSDLGNNFVKSFYFDSRGDFWAGTLGGGLTYHSSKIGKSKRYIHIEGDNNSLSDSRVIPILEDSQGFLWIGTYGGLNRFESNEEKFIHYKYQPYDNTTISNDRIYSIYESQKGELWIGTYQGLNKYLRETDSFERITVENGLADNTIFGMLEDENGNLWVRTNKGISKFDPVKRVFNNYNSSDGLIGLESNGSIYFKNEQGKMFFGGLKGFNSFYPSAINDNKNPPEVVFTELKVMDKVIKDYDQNYLEKSLNEVAELTLSYKDKVFSIEFASLHYSIPSKNKYAYMLEGFRDKWIFVDADNRTASYTNLAPGEYTFHVQGSNNDGVWNEVGKSLKVIVTPPYWDTWWFRILAFIALLAIIFIAYEYRLQRLLAVERTRARIARNLHDDVGGTLASIQYFVDAIRKSIDKKNVDKFLNLIMASSNDAQEKIRDIIWTVNPKEDGLSKFLIRFNRYASDLLDSNEIKYIIKFPKVEEEKKIDMEKRQHLWCICKETITNAIKHSKCENVKISFLLNGNALTYIIEDDGIGFDKISTPPGNGLSNISFRAEKINAVHKISSSENKGVKLEISFSI